MPGILNLRQQTTDQTELRILDNYQNYFINLVAKDIQEKRPDLVFVDAAPYNMQLHSQNINYLYLLLKNKNFYNVWKQV